MTDLTLEHVRAISHDLAKRIMTWDEPIPGFDSRFPNLLESCLLTPQQTFDGKPLYPTLTSRAAILFYLLIKDHPFKNGNKRIAVTSLLVFLWLNGRWMKTQPTKLYRFALLIAQSDPEFKEGMIQFIESYVKKRSVRLS